MEKYKDIPMDYADATLVSIAEDLSVTHVVTFDVKDFGIYRLPSKQPFVILPWKAEGLGCWNTRMAASYLQPSTFLWLLELRAVETPPVDTTALPVTPQPHKFDYETPTTPIKNKSVPISLQLATRNL